MNTNPWQQDTVDPRRSVPPGPGYGRGFEERREVRPLHRFLGGSPGAVLVRLVFLSLVVGAVMALVGITPGRLIGQALDAVRAIYDLGFETLGEVGRWLVTGAVVVVPLWLLSRLLGGAR